MRIAATSRWIRGLPVMKRFGNVSRLELSYGDAFVTTPFMKRKRMSMTNLKNEKNSALSRWHIMLGVIPVLLLGACAEEASAPPADHPVTVTARFIDNQTGAIQEVTRTVDRSALEGVTDDTAAEKAGCTHIRFCSTTFSDFAGNHSNTVVCDTNDQVCSSNSRFSECNSDANFVCGRTRPMGFSPGIPCPISGICSSSGLTLVFISSTTEDFTIP